MHENKFSEYWAHAQFCYFKAEAAKGPVAKHLWLQMAQDWIALAETVVPQIQRQNNQSPVEQLEPFVAA